jgi:hypothetical protein
MHQIDRALLEHCLQGYTRLKPLLEHTPQGTLYRHANRLKELGWLEWRNSYYRTTTEGQRQLDATQSSRRWDVMGEVYAPLREVPTAAHRALAELALVGVVCRQSSTRDDRHPFFVAAGATFHWKTTLGEFLCHALGLDPGRHLVECGAETGRSLFVRRSATGSLVYKRELLDSPFLVLDDYHAADPTARKALQPVLSGRLSVPLENDQVTIRSVPLLTLNPGNHKELEKRLGLSAAHIRRAVITNLDAVPMPDLARTGEQAIKAAKHYGPIVLNAPRADCLQHLQPTVTLLRAMMVPEAYERIDVQVILNLSTGMTVFVPDPEAAIAQVCYDLGILADTLGWVRSGWVQSVTNFALSSRPSQHPQASVSVSPSPDEHHQTRQLAAVHETIDLTTPRIQRDPALPSLTLSNKLRSRLAWLEEETGRPTEEILNLLIDHYVKWRRDPAPVATLHKILLLGRSLEMMELDVDAVHRYLIAESDLKRIGCTIDDIPPGIRLLELLSSLPEAWTWGMAQDAIQSVAYVIRADISPKEVRRFLSLHRRLSEKGLDAGFVAALDKAFTRAGIRGRRRDRAIKELVSGAALTVDVDELEATRLQLQVSVQSLEVIVKNLNKKISDAKERLAGLQKEEAEATQHLEQISREYERKSSHIEALEGFERFLLRRLKADDPFWNELERLLEMRRMGEASAEQAKETLTAGLAQKLIAFVTQLAAQVREAGTVLH